ncbi:MAG: hypothetical protein A2W86_12675 [Bacteroidetes bacterium GWD2_45_23]|nr:MAG: hypothetical protein A2W87_09055 [Bacteroidetes bacterium GWC2_46_850]OFX82652.1 MAG: hypothetical protein A2W86_12675 [Bacteroidetes bacterium GWD2_45_23]HCC17842.1 hypothetical protein [Porphyromonadaceae bacterium]
MRDIKNLHDKYFRGETTHDEEQFLREYFLNADRTDDQMETGPLFTYFSEEASVTEFLKGLRADLPAVHKNKIRRIRLLRVLSMAACLLLGVVLLNRIIRDDNMLTENSVWINGEKITHIGVVRAYAETSFEKVKSEENMLEEQLRFMLE